MHATTLFWQLAFLFLYAASAYAETPILLYYYERVPYAVKGEQGNITGLVATPAAKAFKQAAIPFQWKEMPFKRQVATIKYNKKKACGIGWFKNSEREQFANYTTTIYQDKPSIVISNKNNESIVNHETLKDLLADKSLTLLVKDSFSYGNYIDDQIEKNKPTKKVVVNTSNVQMLQMLLSGRADYFFTSAEEADEMISSAGYSMTQFQIHNLSDMPKGNNRYIACSKQVNLEIVEKLNNALK